MKLMEELGHILPIYIIMDTMHQRQKYFVAVTEGHVDRDSYVQREGSVQNESCVEKEGGRSC